MPLFVFLVPLYATSTVASLHSFDLLHRIRTPNEVLCLNFTITYFCWQVAAAVARARVALFMVDAREGVTPLDKHFALWARKQPDPPEGPRKWVLHWAFFF